jgi:hypothetical protein
MRRIVCSAFGGGCRQPLRKTCEVVRIILAGLLLSIGCPSLQGAPILYATDASAQTLNVLSLEDGSATLVGSFGVGGYMAGLAYDARNGILYGTTTGTDNLYSINTATGSATLIGPLGATYMHGLAFDNSTGSLYGAYGSSFGDGLYSIDTSTGTANFIGHIGFVFPSIPSVIQGLAVHPTTHVLYGVVLGSALIQIDKVTGQGTLVAMTQATAGLAFHPLTNVLYGVDNGSGVSPDTLYTIDISTGQATRVGQTELGNNLGLEFGGWIVPEPSSGALIGVGAISLLGYAWRRRESKRGRS